MSTRAVAAAAAVVLLAAGCGGNEGQHSEPPPTASQSVGTPGASTTPITPQPIPPGNPTKTPAGGLPRPSQVNSLNPSVVAATVAAITYRYDTAIDNSPSDAQRRAKPWLTSEFARLLELGPVAAPGAEWNTWIQHRAYTTSTAVDATEDGAPPDTTTRADRTIAVTVHPVGRDRWHGASQQYALFIELTRDSVIGSWKVSRLLAQE
ncbi:hypothetical protein [Kribbella sp. NBC_00889]|uniref:hypothetical protein n=1 Tax=Kribbella sp. NBC_00889 TaxID=2975974 RepID=UPI00386CBE24|nr:hypothetical protein OG817_13155 [Kribbella sp. NBC_00889]